MPESHDCHQQRFDSPPHIVCSLWGDGDGWMEFKSELVWLNLHQERSGSTGPSNWGVLTKFVFERISCINSQQGKSGLPYRHFLTPESTINWRGNSHTCRPKSVCESSALGSRTYFKGLSASPHALTGSLRLTFNTESCNLVSETWSISTIGTAPCCLRSNGGTPWNTWIAKVEHGGAICSLRLQKQLNMYST